jgi:hypothetical protein
LSLGTAKTVIGHSSSVIGNDRGEEVIVVGVSGAPAQRLAWPSSTVFLNPEKTTTITTTTTRKPSPSRRHSPAWPENPGNRHRGRNSTSWMPA